jgi:hypothetical protein
LSASLLLLATAAIAVAAIIRIALVLSVTPTGYWLAELYALVQSDSPADPAKQQRATWLSKYLSDPALALTRLPGCADQGTPGKFDSCLEVVDAGLEALPASAELWLERARLLLASGRADSPFLTALRESYRNGSREGWVAGQRVVVALGAYRLLPEDLKQKVGEDLELVLASPSLSEPLVQAYIANPHFREIAKSAIGQISTIGQARFIESVMSKTNDPASPER